MKSFERVKEYILPYILTLLLCTSIFGIYDHRIFTGYNIASAVIILVMFLFFGFMKKHKIAGTFIYIAAVFAVLSLVSRFIYAGDWGSGFLKWFLSAGEDAEFRKRYFYAFLTAFPFFFSTTVYYFSIVLYRTSFLMLSSLVPCALYVKVLEDISNTYLVCIAGLNAAMLLINTRRKRTALGAYHGKRAGLLSAAAIVSVSLLLSSLIPKQGEAVHYDKFEKYFMNAGQGNDMDFSALGKHSSDAGKFRALSYIPLYDVTAPDVLHFRRQCFDIYNSKEHCFYPLEKYSVPVSRSVYDSMGERAALNLDDMLAAIKRGAVLGAGGNVNEKLTALEKAGDVISEARIVPENNHSAGYLITSLRTFSVDSSLPEGTYGFTRHGQAAAVKNKIESRDGSFGIEYYPEGNSRKVWLESGGANFTDESYSEYLDNLKKILAENGETEYYNTAAAFESEFDSAMEYKADYAYNNSEIPDDIAELAADITEGCKYDYQKAEAIREHFLSGGYTYDLEYFPPDGMNTASYFVFTSKRGTCSDFAAAYTLMARSAGLTARYTEGYSPSFKSRANGYKIYEKDAHAYSEVYIQNTGWMVFDPTVGYDGDIAFNMRAPADMPDTGIGFSIDTGRLLSVIRLICTALAVSAVIIIIVPSAARLYDNIRIRRGGADGIILAYKRICSAAERRLKINTAAFTPQELCESIYSRTGTDLTEFTELYEKVCFGGASPDKAQSEYAYLTFRKTLKCLRKFWKHRKITD